METLLLAAVLLTGVGVGGGQRIFSDGFESTDTSRWSPDIFSDGFESSDISRWSSSPAAPHPGKRSFLDWPADHAGTKFLNDLLLVSGEVADGPATNELFREVLVNDFSGRLSGESSDPEDTALRNLVDTYTQISQLVEQPRHLTLLDGFDNLMRCLGLSQEQVERIRAPESELERRLTPTEGEIEQAFYALDRYRALGELELIHGTRGTLPSHLEARQRALANNIDEITRQLWASSAKGKRETRSLEIQKACMRSEWELILGLRIRSAGIDYGQQVTIEELQESLDTGTLMLAFSVRASGTDLFLLTAEDPLELHHIPISYHDLQLEVERFRSLIMPQLVGKAQGPEDLLREGDLQATVDLGKAIYSKILGGVEGAIQRAERLLILPDGPLCDLSFAALVREKANDYRGWEYLVEWRPIHMAQSSAIYAGRTVLPSEDESRQMDILMFGNPVASPGRFRGEYPELIHAERELREIGRLFGETEIYLGEEATETRVKEMIGDADIVHLSAHGSVNDKYMLESFLIFTALGQGGPGDGILQVWEIIDQLTVRADLVVLSACETAVGEGLMSLGRAFQIAGARSVVASLWAVADESTAGLMIRFYRHLVAGKSKDEALRSAQLELIHRPAGIKIEGGKLVVIDHSAPYYWAAFQLSGDWQ